MITPKMVERAVRGGGSPQAVTLEDWHRALAARKIAPTTFVWDEQGDRLHLLAFDFYGRRIAVARFVASFIMSCGAADTGEFIPGDEPGAVIDRVRDRIRERVRVGTL